VAQHAGFCFGVERAVNIALEETQKDAPLYCLGQLIHNPQVVSQLAKQGLKVIERPSEANCGTMIVRSHGLPKATVEQAQDCGLKIVDATCPFVRRAQELAEKLASQGYQVILIGDPGHPEVCAIVGSACGEVTVANSPEMLKQLEVKPKVGLLAQTTQDFTNLRACAGELLGRVQELRIYNTICTATEKRMAAARELATRVQLMLVIGGKNSANTKRLAQVCRATGVPTYHIETEAELDPNWFRGLRHVGVTAGASTPKWMIEGVVCKMTELEQKEVQQEIEVEAQAQPQEVETETQPQEVEAKPQEAEVETQPEVEAQAQPQEEEATDEEVATAGEAPAETTQAQSAEPEQEDMESQAFPTINQGDIIKGKVIQVTDDEAMVDIGYKSEGVIHKGELAYRPVASANDVLSVGDEIDVYVERVEDGEGNPVLSKRKADAARAWVVLEEAHAKGEAIEAPVLERVKGGLLVDVGVRGFVPASHVDRRFVDNLEQFIGEVWKLKVLEMDRERNNVVLSRRAVLEEEFQQVKHEVYDTLTPGEIVDGEVKRLTDFGAFVDIGKGVEGLLHVSEMAFSRVKHPSDVVSEGDKIKVMILSVDKERERLSLGLKQTLPDPWENVSQKYPEGSIVEGEVTRLVDFGAFVKLEDGIEGLVHISQLANRHVAKPDEVVQSGELVKVKVISVDAERHRIGLSIREVEQPAKAQDQGNSGSDDYQQSAPEVTLGDLFGDMFKDQEAKEQEASGDEPQQE
jgi:(E)-4-hydroxy-3-methyl-but-2-enyl pyrophosphate reductase